jgi:hypothetical protein
MQPEWWLAVPAIFGFGVLVGYLIRALKSRRRRHWSTYERAREMRHAGILPQSARHEEQSSERSDSLRCAPDAPPVSISELGGSEQTGALGGSNSTRSKENRSRKKTRDGNIVDVPTAKGSV